MKQLLVKFSKFIFGKSSSSSMPRYFVLVFDILLIFIAILISLIIKFYPNLTGEQFVGGLQRSTLLIVYFIIAFLISGSYKGMVRYSGFQDIEKVFKVVALVFLSVCLTNYLANNFDLFSFLKGYITGYSTSFFICITALILSMISRLMVRRIYNEYIRPQPKIINTVIYGAGDAGIITLNALSQDTRNQYNVVAFLDDSDSKVGKSINGITIRNAEVIFDKEFINSKKIETVILAMPSLGIEQKKELLDKLLDTGLNVKSVPHIDSWLDNNQIGANQIEDIKIEDLLEREPIKLGKENVVKELAGKVVLVTGAAGSIGSEICRQVIQHNPKTLIMLDQAESPLYELQFELNNESPYNSISVPKEYIIGNVKDKVKMEEVFKRFNPQIIYHAAAYKHVPLMESFPYEAVFVNVFGTKNIADLAIKYGAEKFVMVSTDKAVNPTNVMGATKRIAEIYTQSRNSATKFVTTRFGNVLGSNGSVIPLFKKQLAHGGPLTVTSRDIIRYFMTIPEACSLVLEAGAIGDDDDVFVFDMGKPVRIYDLASKMIKLSRIPNVQIEITHLRPGEKLYEELLATKENTLPTENPKIMRAKVREYTEEDVNRSIELLGEILPTCDDFSIVRQMKKIVPEFKSNNSVFQALDNEENTTA